MDRTEPGRSEVQRTTRQGHARRKQKTRSVQRNNINIWSRQQKEVARLYLPVVIKTSTRTFFFIFLLDSSRFVSVLTCGPARDGEGLRCHAPVLLVVPEV